MCRGPACCSSQGVTPKVDLSYEEVDEKLEAEDDYDAERADLGSVQTHWMRSPSGEPLTAAMRPGNLSENFKDCTAVESNGGGASPSYLKETTLPFIRQETDEPSVEFEIDLNIRYQEILGFGGAFTDATIHCLEALPEESAKVVLEKYFGNKPGSAAYSIGRLHMGSCDFSLRHYSLCKEGDFEMKTFALEPEDYRRIKWIQKAQSVAGRKLWLFGSPWTAPPWLKLDPRLNINADGWVGGRLNPDPKHSAAWALYMSKWVTAYKEKGIDVSALTMQNEPTQLPNVIAQTWETMCYTPDEARIFVGEHLGPQLRKDHGRDVKLIVHDSQRNELPHAIEPIMEDKKAGQFVDAIGYHWYQWPPAYVTGLGSLMPNVFKNLTTTDEYLKKIKRGEVFIFGTEACNGFSRALSPPGLGPSIGNWNRGEMYAEELIRTTNNFSAGWCDWNMVLNTEGGPNWAKNVCDAPVIANLKTGALLFQPMFYMMVHLSRYVRPGARRVKVTPSKNTRLQVLAAQNPDGSLAVVILNRKKTWGTPRFTYRIKLQSGLECVRHEITAASIQTLIFAPKEPDEELPVEPPTSSGERKEPPVNEKLRSSL